MRYSIYDCETRSALDLSQFGAHNYARDPSTDLWFVSFCILTNGIPGPILRGSRVNYLRQKSSTYTPIPKD